MDARKASQKSMRRKLGNRCDYLQRGQLNIGRPIPISTLLCLQFSQKHISVARYVPDLETFSNFESQLSVWTFVLPYRNFFFISPVARCAKGGVQEEFIIDSRGDILFKGVLWYMKTMVISSFQGDKKFSGGAAPASSLTTGMQGCKKLSYLQHFVGNIPGPSSN